jgi:hypothetical protein
MALTWPRASCALVSVASDRAIRDEMRSQGRRARSGSRLGRSEGTEVPCDSSSKDDRSREDGRRAKTAHKFRLLSSIDQLRDQRLDRSLISSWTTTNLTSDLSSACDPHGLAYLLNSILERSGITMILGNDIDE